jgi:tetratricopeptide (TPR) repeat protein
LRAANVLPCLRGGQKREGEKMIGYVFLIIVAMYLVYLAAKSTSQDTEIIIGQKKEIRAIGERIQEVLDAEKIEKKVEREHRTVITEAKQLAGDNRLKQAESKYLSIIKDDHDNVKAYQGLGEIYLEQEEYEGAVEVFTKVSELDPTNDMAFTNLGTALMKLDKYEEAIYAFEHAVALDGKVPHRYINLALAAEKSGDSKKQIAALEHAADLEPEKIEYLETIAKVAMESGDDSAAKESLNKIVVQDPDNLEAHRMLARLEK